LATKRWALEIKAMRARLAGITFRKQRVHHCRGSKPPAEGGIALLTRTGSWEAWRV
jgi:hypothetical protein